MSDVWGTRRDGSPLALCEIRSGRLSECRSDTRHKGWDLTEAEQCECCPGTALALQRTTTVYIGTTRALQMPRAASSINSACLVALRGAKRTAGPRFQSAGIVGFVPTHAQVVAR